MGAVIRYNCNLLNNREKKKEVISRLNSHVWHDVQLKFITEFKDIYFKCVQLLELFPWGYAVNQQRLKLLCWVRG